MNRIAVTIHPNYNYLTVAATVPFMDPLFNVYESRIRMAEPYGSAPSDEVRESAEYKQIEDLLGQLMRLPGVHDFSIFENGYSMNFKIGSAFRRSEVVPGVLRVLQQHFWGGAECEIVLSDERRQERYDEHDGLVARYTFDPVDIGVPYERSEADAEVRKTWIKPTVSEHVDESAELHQARLQEQEDLLSDGDYV